MEEGTIPRLLWRILVAAKDCALLSIVGWCVWFLSDDGTEAFVRAGARLARHLGMAEE